MKLEVFADEAAAARAAAAFIAAQARAAKGNFALALSGGRSPWLMLDDLSYEDVPWDALHVAQVDERVAPAGDPDRNLTHLQASLLVRAPLRADQIYPMPVESVDLDAASGQYATTLQTIAGTPPVFDLIHLGLGPDGHTASLVPGDPVLQVDDRDVAVTGLYQGRRRMTLTYPVIDRARCLLWLVTGEEKAQMLARLLRGDRSIPAGRVEAGRAVVIADRAAAGQSQPDP